MRRSLILLACFFSAAAHAQGPSGAAAPPPAPRTVVLEFGSDGERVVWQRPATEPDAARAGKGVTGVSMDFTLDPGQVVGVADKATGKVAERPTDAVMKEGRWVLKPADFKRVYQVDVQVVHDLKPVASAMVSLKAGSESRSTLLSPEGKGVVSFFNLPAGPYEVRAQYKAEGQDKQTPVQRFSPAADGGKPLAILLSIADKVDTVAGPEAAPAAGASGSGAPAPEGKPAGGGGSPFGTFASIVIAAAVVGAAGYGVYWYLKRQPDQAKDLLKKAGLDPDAADQAGQKAAAIAPPQPKPLQPIVLGAADPIAPPSAAPVAPAASVGSPRLVLDDGTAFVLAEGENSVGRDAAAAISLAGQTGVSRAHAVIRLAGGSVTLADAGSTNGTYLNGMKVSADMPLNPGDQIVFGSTRARFER